MVEIIKKEDLLSVGFTIVKDECEKDVVDCKDEVADPTGTVVYFNTNDNYGCSREARDALLEVIKTGSSYDLCDKNSPLLLGTKITDIGKAVRYINLAMRNAKLASDFEKRFSRYHSIMSSIAAARFGEKAKNVFVIFEEIIMEIEAAIKDDPSVAEKYLIIAKHMADAGLPGPAVKTFKKWEGWRMNVKQKNDPFYIQMEEAKVLARAGKTEEAKSVFEKLISEEEDVGKSGKLFDILSHFNYVADKFGDPDKKQLFGRITSAADKINISTYGRKDLAKALIKAGLKDLAISEVDKIVKSYKSCNTSGEEASVCKVILLSEVGLGDESIALLNETIEGAREGKDVNSFVKFLHNVARDIFSSDLPKERKLQLLGVVNDIQFKSEDYYVSDDKYNIEDLKKTVSAQMNETKKRGW